MFAIRTVPDIRASAFFGNTATEISVRANGSARAKGRSPTMMAASTRTRSFAIPLATIRREIPVSPIAFRSRSPDRVRASAPAGVAPPDDGFFDPNAAFVGAFVRWTTAGMPGVGSSGNSRFSVGSRGGAILRFMVDSGRLGVLGICVGVRFPLGSAFSWRRALRTPPFPGPLARVGFAGTVGRRACRWVRCFALGSGALPVGRHAHDGWRERDGRNGHDGWSRRNRRNQRLGR